MSDEQALLAAIWEQPHEDTPRLAYADWLDEQGGDSNEGRAELIRVQIALENALGDDPRYDALEAREAELLKAWGKTWWKAMPKGCKKGSFSRGFPVPYLGNFSIPGVVELGESRLRAAPLWRYHYGVHGVHLDYFLPWPFLHRLDLFALRPPLPKDWAKRMAACDNLRNATGLALIDCWVKPEEIQLLLDAWEGRHLRDLTLNLKAEGLKVLTEHPTAAGLRSLDIRESRLPAAALKLITKSRYLKNLDRLSISTNSLGDAGLKDFLRWPGMRRLRYLFIDKTGLTDAGAKAIAASPAASNLRLLWLSYNKIGAVGATAIANSKHLAKLKQVSFYTNPVGKTPEVEKLLRKRFGKDVLF